MKKLFIAVIALAVLFSSLSLTAFAEKEKSADVFVTISDASGKLVAVQEKVAVTDVDEDGYLTVRDALYAAHEARFEGGAAAGFGTKNTEYGLSLSKLWGIENGSGYGYYVNNNSCWSLADTVSDGDYVNAFIYSASMMDSYSYFDKNTLNATAGKEFTLTLSKHGYDSDWNTIVLPAENAVITVNGEKTDIKTDATGKATVSFPAAGTYVVSAVSGTETLVPPACIVTVAAAVVPDTGAEENTCAAVLMFAAVISMAVVANMGKKVYEK